MLGGFMVSATQENWNRLSNVAKHYSDEKQGQLIQYAERRFGQQYDSDAKMARARNFHIMKVLAFFLDNYMQIAAGDPEYTQTVDKRTSDKIARGKLSFRNYLKQELELEETKHFLTEYYKRDFLRRHRLTDDPQLDLDAKLWVEQIKLFPL